MMNYSRFTRRKELTKAISFQLIPYGNTDIGMKEEGIIADDRSRKDMVIKVKEIVDGVHRNYIEERLSDVDVDWKALYDAQRTGMNLESERSVYRKKISSILKSGDLYGKMFKADFYYKELPQLVKDDVEKEAVDGVSGFYSYFIKYDGLRSRLYEAEVDRVSVAYRCIVDNFPLFIRNIDSFNTLYERYKSEMDEIADKLSLKYPLDEVFSLSFYSKVLSQKEIDMYNSLIGGKVIDDEIVPGLNQFINEKCQKDKLKLPRFVQLQKQILSENVSKVQIEPIADDVELRSMLREFLAMNEKNHILKKIIDFNLSDMDISHIFVKKNEVPTISMIVAGKWNVLDHSYKECIKQEIGYEKMTPKKAEKELTSYIASKKISIADLERARMQAINDSVLDGFEGSVITSFTEELIKRCRQVISTKTEMERIVESNEPIYGNSKSVDNIKEYLDAYIDLARLFRVFDMESIGIDYAFFDTWTDIMETVNLIVRVYSKTRNYITRKASDGAEKMPVYFRNPMFAVCGWAEPMKMRSVSRPMILLRNGKYYYGAINKENNPKLRSIASVDDESKYFKKMVYHQLEVVKSLPKMVFNKQVKEHFENSNDEIMVSGVPVTYEMYKMCYLKDAETGKVKYSKEYLKKSGNEKEYQKATEMWISFLVEFVQKHPSFAHYDLSTLKPADEYETVFEFYQELNRYSYTITFEYLSVDEIETAVDNAELFLFEITSKGLRRNDNSDFQATYFRELFSEKNRRNPVVKLNGLPRVVYRDACVHNPVVHKAGSKLVARTDTSGKRIPEDIYLEIYRFFNEKVDTLSERAREYLDKVKVSMYEDDIIKDKRYTEPQLSLQLSVQLNYGVNETTDINADVMDEIRNGDVNFLGISRGERNLLYMTLIDKNKNILMERSLNNINGVDYFEKLQQIERERDGQRKNWEQVSRIKDVKDGYLSCAITEIVRTAIDNNAIIVLENLNGSFKDKRSGIERTVYKKFEEKLETRLKCLAFKDREPYEEGGCLNPYQLATGNGGLQDGIIFRVNPAYSSSIDPLTGFVSLFDMSSVHTLAQKKEFMQKMNKVEYNDKDEAYEFTFDYSKFKTYEKTPQTIWMVSTRGTRSVWCDKKWENVNVTKELHESLKMIVNTEDVQTGKLPLKSYGKLFDAFYLSLKMKNYVGETEWFCSPVKNKDGIYFDTRNEMENMPSCIDSNNSYNLALKGCMVTDIIRETTECKWKDMVIKNEDWLKYCSV